MNDYMTAIAATLITAFLVLFAHAVARDFGADLDLGEFLGVILLSAACVIAIRASRSAK